MKLLTDLRGGEQGRILPNTCSNIYIKLLHTPTKRLPISEDTPPPGYTAHQFLW